MATTEQDLDSFHQYARQRISSGDADLSIDELFDLWRSENPSEKVHAQDCAAVAAAIEDFKKGDRGKQKPYTQDLADAGWRALGRGRLRGLR